TLGSGARRRARYGKERPGTRGGRLRQPPYSRRLARFRDRARSGYDVYTHLRAAMALNPLGRIALAIAIVFMLPLPAVGQQESGLTLRNDSLIVRFVNVDVRTAIQALGRHLDRPIAFSDVGDGRITLETPQP